MIVRVLDDESRDAAMVIAAEWDYAPDELDDLIALSQGCSTVALDGDQAVGLTLGFPWGPVGWIGSVRVAEKARGAGLGGPLVAASIEALEDAGCSTVKLYATPKAITLYERLGFVGEAEFLVAGGSHRRGRDPTVEPLVDHLEGAIALDSTIFPGDRARLIRALAESDPALAVCVLDDAGDVAGYGIARASEPASEIGPVVAREGDSAVAQALVDALLTRIPEGDVEVAYPARSWAARNSFDCRGFVTLDTPLEMRRGPAVDEAREAIVAVGGQELG